jgi:capsular polysaccharide export protein
LIAMADELHVNSSLAGFEALLRGKPVTVHGVPFYAGWGLTTDRGPVPARSHLPCPVEVLAHWIAG